jgi:hypothetical protein
MKDVNTNDDMLATFERTVEHLKSNNVDVENTKVGVGVTLQVDPVEEVFTGTTGEDLAAANAMLTRVDRKPYVVPAKGEV